MEQSNNITGSVVNQKRRDFLKSMAAVIGGFAFSPLRIMAGPFDKKDL